MNAPTLINLDDLAKFLIVDRYSENVRKINAKNFVELSKKCSKYDLEAIFTKFARSGDIEEVLEQLIGICKELKVFYSLSIPYTKWMMHYSKLYLKFFHPDSTVKLENCDRYSKENYTGVKVTAARDIPANTIMKNVFGYFKPLTREEEEILTLSYKDFSILNNSRSKKQNIFLGTIAFINHDCHPNTEYITAEKHLVYLKSLKNIKDGEELLVSYGDNYFGFENEDCECLTCSIKKLLNQNVKSVSEDLPDQTVLIAEVGSTNQFVSAQVVDITEVQSISKVVIEQEVLTDSAVSITHASEDLNDSFEFFRGFNSYKKLDKKLPYAVVLLERIDVYMNTLSGSDNAKQNNYLLSLTEEDILQKKKKGYGFCIYCEKLQSQLPRHLRRVHGDKTIVTSALLDDNFPFKNAATSYIRNQGFEHLRQITGIMIPANKVKKDALTEVVKSQCDNCSGYFSEKTLLNHKRNCFSFTAKET